MSAPPPKRQRSLGSKPPRSRAPDATALDAAGCDGQTWPMLRSALLNVMIAAARKAGRSLKRDFGEVEHLQVSLKGPANFVSAADHRAEEILRTELAKARPGYGFLGEEGGRQDGADNSHCWIGDPLAGTTNFLHSIPQFAISIGLQQADVRVAGAIYNAPNAEVFCAARGNG